MSEHYEFKSNELAARRVPCLVAYLHPFRIVDAADSPKWTVSIEQINSGAWDYIALHEIVGGIDVGLESPYHMVVCRDGGLALPPVPELLKDQAAVEFFNRCLVSILLGGMYCEAITLDGLDFGSVLDWKYVRVSTCAPAVANRFHFLIRGQHPSTLDAIALDEPRIILIDDLVKAARTGRFVLENVPSVGGELLLKGVTGYARRDWSTALTSLWIVVEQLTSHLWYSKIVNPARKSPTVSGRIDTLRDNRTWTVGARHEMLYQKGLLDADLYESLTVARKGRNRLAHDGKHPSKKNATAALNSVKTLLGIVLPNVDIPFIDLDLTDHTISDPFKATKRRSLSPKYWMEIKKLPGEAELEKLEAEARKG